MSVRRTLVLTATVALAAGLLAAAPAAAAPGGAVTPQAAVTATVVRTVSPFGRAGNLRLPIDAARTVDGEMCFGSAWALAKNIYQCGSSADHLPACWTVRSSGVTIIVCMSTPTDKKVVAASYFGPKLPKVPAKAKADPWRIVLDDGSICDARIGGAWAKPAGNYDYSYACSGSVGALVAPENGFTLDTSAAHYTARATTDASAGAESFSVGVRQVIYPGALPTLPTQRSGSKCVPDSVLKAAGLPKGYRMLATDQTTCGGGWAHRYLFHRQSAIDGLFHKVDGAWTYVSKDKACWKKGGLPARWLSMCFAG